MERVMPATIQDVIEQCQIEDSREAREALQQANNEAEIMGKTDDVNFIMHTVRIILDITTPQDNMGGEQDWEADEISPEILEEPMPEEEPCSCEQFPIEKLDIGSGQPGEMIVAVPGRDVVQRERYKPMFVQEDVGVSAAGLRGGDVPEYVSDVVNIGASYRQKYRPKKRKKKKADGVVNIGGSYRQKKASKD